MEVLEDPRKASICPVQFLPIPFRCSLIRKSPQLGMVSHKMLIITIFDHKHYYNEKFHQKFDIFHKSTAFDFSSYLVSNA